MDFSMNEMLDMQRQLQEKYKGRWEPISPPVGKNKLLWMIGELVEVIDGDQSAAEPGPIRDHLVEELADVLMYYNDILLCYGITAEELRSAYTAKFQKNLDRW